MNTVSFTKVNLPYGWLGNMSAHALMYGGKRYRTAEALFQCLRYENYPEVQDKIRGAYSPMEAKMIAKKHKNLIEEEMDLLGQKDIDRMRLCLSLKVEQHPEIRRLLLSTGERQIVEDSSKRPSRSGLFWGAKRDSVTGVWVGSNTLGRLWMEIRESLSSKRVL